MEWSAADEQTAFGRCRDCGAELVIGNDQLPTQPERNCIGPTCQSAM
jgi:hypothetical protein